MNQDSVYTFVMKDVDVRFVNALRRTIMMDVPTVRIHRVVVTHNDMIGPVERLIYALGQVAIDAEPRSLKYCMDPDVQTDEDTIEFEMDVSYDDSLACALQGPDLAPPTPVALCPPDVFPRQMTAMSLRYVRGAAKAADGTSKPGIFRACVGLGVLAPGQRVSARCFARKGIGRDHIFYAPAIVSFKPLMSISLADTDTCDLPFVCRHGVFDTDPSTGRVRVVNADACTRCDNCNLSADLTAAAPRVLFKESCDTFIVRIESVCCLSARRLLEDALLHIEQEQKLIVQEVQLAMAKATVVKC